MTTIIQTRCMANRGAGWALWLGLLLALAGPLLALHRPPADPSSSITLFDSGEVELVSFTEGRANAATSESRPASKVDREQAPLFGLETEPLNKGTVVEKWNHTKAAIAQELSAIDQCRANNHCPADVQKLIALSAEGAARSGRAKVGLINRAVDVAISPVSDETQWGVPDRWSAPLETLRSGRGDCEDYAIVKYLALLEAGIPADDVKIVIVKNIFPAEDHAMAAVHVDDQWLILDNRTLTLVRDIDLTRATPEFVLDQEGVRRFVSRGSTWREDPLGQFVR
jgi:predicted transglutaminase-like cysteine proteinase